MNLWGIMIRMENGISIKQMLGMTIGDMQNLRDAQMSIQKVIDRQSCSIKSVIKEAKLDEETAQSILDNLNKQEVNKDGI